ncbi:translation initiation factor IF-3 [Candidatus Gracilibacteria bacterium]|nr:translation initiation factor IF-3 [Candidatus Gracilibacteria bacterium]
MKHFFGAFLSITTKLFDKNALQSTIGRLFSIFYFFNIGISFRGGRKHSSYRSNSPKKLHRINEEVRSPQVRVVDEEGEPLGVMTSSQALDEARTRGVDLVEISPTADPPVCKLIDYGKMLYAFKKKEQQAKKANKVSELKGIRLTFGMDTGDVERQRRHAEEFLQDGNSVRIQLVMRGREKAHRDLAIDKMSAFITSLAEVSKVENAPKAVGHQVIVVLNPSKSSK